MGSTKTTSNSPQIPVHKLPAVVSTLQLDAQPKAGKTKKTKGTTTQNQFRKRHGDIDGVISEDPLSHGAGSLRENKRYNDTQWRKTPK